MVMFGEMLAAARVALPHFDARLDAYSPSMAVALRTAAARRTMDANMLVRCAVSDFSRFASDEDWATLMSALRDAPDPGMSCLEAMIGWHLLHQSDAVIPPRTALDDL